jgi:dTDP-4-amino-4,6-dideoxy-D-galactose acyltransferase
MGTYAPTSGESAVVLHSEVDSQRFGLKVGRLSVSAKSVLSDNEVVAAIMNSGFDLVILRYPSTRLKLGEMVAESTKSSFQADTLLCFSKRIHQADSAILAGDIGVRFAHLGDDAAIRTVAFKAFDSYKSHYAANPQFDTNKILDGYVDWASRQLVDASVVLVHESQQINGFLTLKIENGVAEIVLNAVDPDMQNQGVYQRLIESAVHYATINDCEKIVTSTQSTNYKVMRAWVKYGFDIYLSLNTIHVNLKRLQLG